MNLDTSHSIIKSFKNFFLGTCFSKISGFLRDVSMAFFFGASPCLASFMVAFRFANLFRRLLGETSFQAGFVPYYENLRMQDKKKAAYFYRDLFFSLCCLLVILIFFGEIFLFFISKTFKNHEIISLVQIMLGGLFFISLYGLNSSFLQCHNRYFLASFAPVSFNIIWIACVIFFRQTIDQKFVYILSIAVVIAFFFQYLTTAFRSFKIASEDLNFSEFLKPKLFSLEIKKLIKPIFLSIIGIGAVQLNSALDAVFANIAQRKGPAYLWYAMRLYQMPISLFAIAITAAILPPLTRAYKLGDLVNFKKFLDLALTKSFGLMMPCTIALIVLGPSMINLIYTRGAFNQNDLINTTLCLMGYATGLSFSTFVMIIVQAFWAKKEYIVPTIAAILAVIGNILLNSLFIFGFNMKSVSIAIATSLSSVLNFLILLIFLKKKMCNLFQKEIFLAIFKISMCSILAGLCTIYFGYFIKDASVYFLLNHDFSFPRSLLDKIYSFSLLSFIYLLTLFVFAFLTRTQEISELINRKKIFSLDKDRSDA